MSARMWSRVPDTCRFREFSSYLQSQLRPTPRPWALDVIDPYAHTGDRQIFCVVQISSPAVCPSHPVLEEFDKIVGSSLPAGTATSMREVCKRKMKKAITIEAKKRTRYRGAHGNKSNGGLEFRIAQDGELGMQSAGGIYLP